MLEVAGSLAKSDPENDTIQHNLAVSHVTHAQALMQVQRWDEALAALQAAFAIDSRSNAKSVRHRRHPACLQQLPYGDGGRVRVHLGQTALAETDAQVAQDLLESAARLDPDNAIVLQDLIRAYDFRGDLYEGRSEGAQARQWFQRALEMVHAHAAMNIAAEDRDDWGCPVQEARGGNHPDGGRVASAMMLTVISLNERTGGHLQIKCLQCRWKLRLVTRE